MTTADLNTSAPTRLRDLSDEDFFREYDSDRFTASILLNRLRYAAEHMATGLLRDAFSPIIRDWYDFAFTITGPPEEGYPMAAVSNSLSVFLGTMSDAVPNTVKEYGPENLRPGDVLVCNDPYRGGRHVNDMIFIRPVFHGGKVVSYVTLCAHLLDIGGTVPGGFSATKLNVFENGLVIPPMLMWSADEPVKSTFSIIFDNSRLGALLLPDFKSFFQHLRMGERLVLENIEKYGLETYLGTLKYACDTSAERMRDAIATIPDGDYVGHSLIDADGVDDTREYPIQITFRKRGDNIEADLSGTSPQARGSINATPLDAKTYIAVALTMLLDPHAPFTSGSWRNIDLVAPPGTILSALPPDGPTMMFFEVGTALHTAVLDALNPALGENGLGGDMSGSAVHNGTGVFDDGTPWSNVCMVGGEHGPWGASKAADGESYNVPYSVNSLDPATEQIEHDTPCVLLRKEHVIDTGGAGTHRGGAANRKDTLWIREATHVSNPFRFKKPTGVGANGGAAGPNGGVWVFPPQEGAPDGRRELIPTTPEAYASAVPIAGVLDPETKTLDPQNGTYHYFSSRPHWDTEPGTSFRYQTNGGGGWGDPFARDPRKVLADVQDEYVSVERAARDYGVVIVGDPAADPEGLRIDEAETATLRGSRVVE